MTTKEEYEKAVKNIKDAFYAKSVNSVLATENFKTNLDFLSGLVNEHFEERAETNYDHFKDEIIERVKSVLSVVKGEPKPCNSTYCDDCDFFGFNECTKEVKGWLNQPYEKPIYKLTQFEYDLLQLCSVDFKFKEMIVLKEMKEKGHFKNIDSDKLIKDILANCEVIE